MVMLPGRGLAEVEPPTGREREDSRGGLGGQNTYMRCVSLVRLSLTDPFEDIGRGTPSRGTPARRRTRAQTIKEWGTVRLIG